METKTWYEGSSSSHDTLRKSDTGFLGPGVYLAENFDLAVYYARLGGAPGFVRKVRVSPALSVRKVQERYSEDHLREADAKSKAVHQILDCDAILLVGRGKGREMILSSVEQGFVVEEQRIEFD